MNRVRPRFAAIGAFLLAALFLGPSSSLPVHAQDAQPAAPPPGKALLYIFRSDRQPSDALVPLAVNAETAGYLENGTFVAVVVGPGRVFLRSGDRAPATLRLEAAADQSYYVRVQAVHGLTVVQTEIDLVDEADGRSALAQSRFMMLAQPPAPTARPAPAAPAAFAQETGAGPGTEPGSPEEPSAADRRMYVRLDLGYSKSTGADIADNNFANSGIICGDATCTTAGKLKDVGGGGLLSAGVGYRFSPHTRGDLTVALRSYRMNTSDASVPATNFKADVTSLSAMANGYFDFATTGVSPYIGVGVGFSQNRIGTLTFDDGAGFNGSIENAGTTSGAAAAFMAGIGIPLSGQTVLDIGYRYSSLGKLKIEAVAGYDGATGKLNAHELTVGLRF